MKKVLIAAAFAMSLVACNNSGNGVESGDTAATTLGDTMNTLPNSGVDTSSINTCDRDKMVTREETINVFQSLPNAQLAILPATPHPLEQADSSLIAYHLQRFLA